MSHTDDELIEDEIVVEVRRPRRLRFSPPVEWGKDKCDSIVLRSPSLAVHERVQNEANPIARLRLLIQATSQKPMAIVMLLPEEVLIAAGEYFGPLSEASPSTGETSSPT